MATRREVRRSIGQFRYNGRRLLEFYTTASAGATTTVTLPGTNIYPAQATHFDMYGLSIVGGTRAGDDAVVTNFVDTTQVWTIAPALAAAADSTSVVEVWLPGLNSTLINDQINHAIDLVRDESLQEWHSTALCTEADRIDYPLPTGSRFIYAVQVYKAVPATGNAVGNMNSFVGLADATARTRLAQGFQVGSDTLVRGVVLYLRKVGTISPGATLTADIEGATGQLPNGLQVTGATATRSTDLINGYGRLVFFDFGRPVLLTSGTQYTTTLDTSGAVSSTNYIQWGADSSNRYGLGQRSAASDEGTIWTATSGEDHIFHIVPWNNDWLELNGHEWDLSIETTDSFLQILQRKGQPLPHNFGAIYNLTEGRPIRLLGYQRAARPTVDTDEIDIPRTYLEAKALSLVLLHLGDPKLAPIIAHLETVAQRELQIHPVRTLLRSNARRVTTSGA